MPKASQCKDAVDGSLDLFSDIDFSPIKNLDLEESIIIEEVDTDDDSDNDLVQIIEEESSEEEEEVEECVEDEEVDDEDLDEPYLAGTFVSSLSDIEESEGEEDHADKRRGDETLYTLGNDVSFGQWEEDKEAMSTSLLSEASPAISDPSSSRLAPLCEENEDGTRYDLADDVDQSPASAAIQEEPEDLSASSVMICTNVSSERSFKVRL